MQEELSGFVDVGKIDPPYEAGLRKRPVEEARFLAAQWFVRTVYCIPKRVFWQPRLA